MKRSIAAISLLVVLLVLVSFSLAAAEPQAPGTPTLRWVTTSSTTAELRADNITDGGIPGNGAMTWDIYFRYPASVPAPLPSVSIVAGPLFVAQSPCTFTTNVTEGMPSEPGSAGNRGVMINGFCTTGIANNPVTGSNILVATVTLTSCSAQGFVMDLDDGVDVFGSGVSQLADRTGDGYLFTDSDLTDGAPMCGSPTAVTMTGLDAASSSAAPFAAAAWPLLAGAAAVAAGGAYALLRRKS
ncbi:MAG: hypothetical protein IAE85_17130 [Anaerolinea sp.]|nr:hypothetical protein [Anaerolinea sp.]